jgi:hypothetical protein
MPNVTKTRSRRWWLHRGMAVAGASLIVALPAVSWAIASGVRAASGVAMREYGGDPVSALMAFAAAPSQSLRDRNRAVWALGQLGDPRALVLLEQLYTGKPCDHSRQLCQRDLKKAIHLCRGGLNLPALMWRHGS